MIRSLICKIETRWRTWIPRSESDGRRRAPHFIPSAPIVELVVLCEIEVISVHLSYLFVSGHWRWAVEPRWLQVTPVVADSTAVAAALPAATLPAAVDSTMAVAVFTIGSGGVASAALGSGFILRRCRSITLRFGGVAFRTITRITPTINMTARKVSTKPWRRRQGSEASGCRSFGGTEVIAYPKSGQSADQQANDKYECHSWAVTQSGFDPAQRSTASARERDDYMRAQAACLVGRGYSVE